MVNLKGEKCACYRYQLNAATSAFGLPLPQVRLVSNHVGTFDQAGVSEVLRFHWNTADQVLISPEKYKNPSQDALHSPVLTPVAAPWSQHHALRMANLEATTPQLKVVKRITDAISSRAPRTAESVISKDYMFRTFPKSDELPDLTKEEYLQMYGVALALFANVEVCIKYLGTVFKFIPNP